MSYFKDNVLEYFLLNIGVQHGTHIIGQVAESDYYCDTISFPTAFEIDSFVKVFTSVSFGTNSSHVHDVVFTWVESVTHSDFKACVVEGGVRSDVNLTLNWMAFDQTESSVESGSIKFRDWTTGTRCEDFSLKLVRLVIILNFVYSCRSSKHTCPFLSFC